MESIHWSIQGCSRTILNHGGSYISTELLYLDFKSAYLVYFTSIFIIVAGWVKQEQRCNTGLLFKAIKRKLNYDDMTCTNPTAHLSLKEKDSVEMTFFTLPLSLVPMFPAPPITWKEKEERMTLKPIRYFSFT